MVEQYYDKLDKIFYALSDPTRREIVHLISSNERTVSELAEPFDMSLAAVSKHIKVLEQAGLLRRTVSGRMHTCRLNSEALSLVTKWLKFYEQFWTNQFDAFQGYLYESDQCGLFRGTGCD